jgi:hypothetical protein
MVEDRISLNIAESEKDAIREALQILQDKLMPKLITLSVEERSRLTKMGDKSFSFVKDAKLHIDQNPKLVPGYLDVEEMTVDLRAVEALKEYYNTLQQLLQAVDDTMMLSGSEAMVTALSFYTAVKGASKQKAPGAKVVYDDLKRYFTARGKKLTEG